MSEWHFLLLWLLILSTKTFCVSFTWLPLPISLPLSLLLLLELFKLNSDPMLINNGNKFAPLPVLAILSHNTNHSIQIQKLIHLNECSNAAKFVWVLVLNTVDHYQSSRPNRYIKQSYIHT